jgi:Kdo2-lipid IVA lauroyltransferase/acyltransferase
MDERPLRKEIKYTALYWFIRFLIFLSGILPRTVWLSFCGFLGLIGYLVSPKPRKQSITHLEMAFGKEKSPSEIRKLAREMFIMLGKNVGEIVRGSRIRTIADMDEFVVVHGYEHAIAARDKGKGVIFIPCHLGAFELMVTFVSLHGFKPMVIGTALKDERLNELMVNYRNAHGAIPVQRGKETLKLFKGLKQGGSTAVLIDQDTKVKSRFVDFFGMPASTPIGATILALKTGATVLPAYIHLGKDNLQHITFLPEIPLVVTGDEETDLVVNTQNYTRYIEKVIREHPTQWVWMHERWKTKPGEEIR